MSGRPFAPTRSAQHRRECGLRRAGCAAPENARSHTHRAHARAWRARSRSHPQTARSTVLPDSTTRLCRRASYRCCSSGSPPRSTPFARACRTEAIEQHPPIRSGLSHLPLGPAIERHRVSVPRSRKSIRRTGWTRVARSGNLPGSAGYDARMCATVIGHPKFGACRQYDPLPTPITGRLPCGRFSGSRFPLTTGCRDGKAKKRPCCTDQSGWSLGVA
jgi:hypothetical protein